MQCAIAPLSFLYNRHAPHSVVCPALCPAGVCWHISKDMSGLLAAEFVADSQQILLSWQTAVSAAATASSTRMTCAFRNNCKRISASCTHHLLGHICHILHNGCPVLQLIEIWQITGIKYAIDILHIALIRCLWIDKSIEWISQCTMHMSFVSTFSTAFLCIFWPTSRLPVSPGCNMHFAFVLSAIGFGCTNWNFTAPVPRWRSCQF